MKKRILGALLTLCMVVALLPTTAQAAATFNNVMPNRAALEGGQDSNIYFGTYAQTSDDPDPIKWRLLDDYGSYYVEASVPDEAAFAEDTYYIFNVGTQEFDPAEEYDSGATYYEARSSLLLLADQGLAIMPYHNESTDVIWETCTLRSWMNGLDEAGTYGANVANPYDGSFIDTAFSDEEQDALGFSTVINNGNSYRIGEPIGASDLTQDKLFPLSLDEAMNEDYGFSTDMNEDAARVATESYNNQPFVWWLRSPDEASEEIGEGTFVVSTGAIEANGGWVYNPFMVRPAFHLDYGSVLLSTAADFDNSSAFARTEQYNGDDWKLTLKDSNTDFGAGMEHTTIARGDTATVAIDDLGDGADYTQISAMLIRSGDIYAYGRIGSASTGEKSFTIPANLPVGDYTLRLFAEEVNGEYLTSYASNTVDMEITVTYPPYPVGTRLKLTGGSAWFVLEDGVEHFTLVRDGFLSGTYARFGADTLITAEQAIEDYQTEAREIFDDDGAATRLPARSEFENIISGSIHFSDQDTAFWLSDEYVNDLPGDTGYYYAEGDSYYNWRSGDDFIAVRPVLMVSKAAFLAVEPVITEQPADLQFFTLYGNDAVFSVTATGTNLTYQWQVYDGSYWVNLDGETASRLTLDRNDENYAEGKTFRCELDSDWGEPVYTDEAQLLLGNWLQYGLEYAQPGTDYTVSEDENTVTVHTAAGLGWVAAQVNGGDPYSGKTLALGQALDLSARLFVPIGTIMDPFQGNFNGGMHTVSGLNILYEGFYIGLFGYAAGGTLENLVIADGMASVPDAASPDDATEYAYFGALCGRTSAATIRNIGVGGVTVTSGDREFNNDNKGGIVGYLGGGSLSNCYSRAMVSGGSDAFIGGLAGYMNQASAANCYFAGSLNGSSHYKGAVTGWAANSGISGCYWLDTYSDAVGYAGDGETVIGCAAKPEAQMKAAAFASTLNSWVTAENTTAGLEIFETWAVIGSENGGYPSFGPPAPAGGGGGDSAVRTITVTETSSPLFRGSLGAITAQANMEKAFSHAVEVKVTDTNEDAASFGLGEGNAVYPFDIALYIRGTNTRTQPAPGYAVTISLPVPESLLDKKEQLAVIHKSDDGIVTTCSSRLEHRAGVWYLVFEATEFSPYALVLRSAGIYEGVPYYLDDSGSKVFIGFAANRKYIAPDGVTVSVMGNSKSFVDVSGHWAAGYIGFVTEREIFLGTGGSAFSPDSGMTRAMFATVIGRLYERSYGTIEASGVHAFTDCDYGAYYGRYVDWAARNNIIGGYGNGRFSPNDQITREQMATILYRFADFLEILPSDMDTALSYPDAESISNYAKNAALFCQTTGVISGRTGGVFAPKETATRAEVAAIIERFVELIVN